MLRRSHLIPIALLAAGLLTAGCKRKVELFCDENTPCTDTVLNYCDLNGIHEASDYIGHTCIPDPFVPDAGTPDADPNAPDADPNAPDAGPQAKVSHVFYTAAISAADKTGLHYTTITDGVVGETYELSGPYTSGTVGVKQFKIAEDRSFAIYSSSESGTMSIYYVDLTTTPPAGRVLISGGTGIGSYFLMQGTSLLFEEDPNQDGTSELRFVRLAPTGPSASVPVGPTLFGASLPVHLPSHLSEDGQHLLFTSSVDRNLYYSYLGGASPTLPDQVNASGVAAYFQVAPDSRSIAYTQGSATVADLYYAPIANGALGSRSKLNGALTSGGSVSTNVYHGSTFQYAPNSSFLLYRADERTDDVYELFAVDLAGASPAPSNPVNGPLAANRSVGVMWIAPDSSKVAYTADQAADDVYELWLVGMTDPAQPTMSRRANGGLVPDADIKGALFSADSQSLYYLADQRTDEVTELFVLDVSTGAPAGALRLSGDMTANGDVYPNEHVSLTRPQRSVFFSRNGALYLADQDTDNVRELYFVDLSGSSPASAKRVHPARSSGERVEWYGLQALQGGNSVIYRAKIAGSTDLWLAPLTGSLPVTPTKLNGPLADGDVGISVTVIEQP